jgi:adenylosuccinate synthase
MKADIILGLQNGDEAKAKVTLSYLSHNPYTACLRSNGGQNSGRSIYLDGKKIIMHIVPMGVIKKIPSIIGAGCVLNPKLFFKELNDLEKEGIEAHKYVKIAYNTHIVTDQHLEEEINESRIGSTRKGISPAYRDKHARIGKRAEDIPELKEYIIDTYDWFYQSNHANHCVLGEIVQGFELDIDHATHYPYCTASHCLSPSFLLNGFPPQCINDIVGVMKIYETYVGTFEFQPKDNDMLPKIAQLGQEFGATTGRLRQVNYLNLNKLIKSVRMNGCTKIVCSKMDILQELNHWRLISNNEIEEHTEESIKSRLLDALGLPIEWGYSPESL